MEYCVEQIYHYDYIMTDSTLSDDFDNLVNEIVTHTSIVDDNSDHIQQQQKILNILNTHINNPEATSFDKYDHIGIALAKFKTRLQKK